MKDLMHEDEGQLLRRPQQPGVNDDAALANETGSVNGSTRFEPP